MGLNIFPWLVFHSWVFLVLCLKDHCDSSEVTLKFLKTPHAFSNLNSATFAFQVFLGGNHNICSNCSTNCKLDDYAVSDCEAGEVSYTGLRDGNHTFGVCTNGSRGDGCASYNWIVDTVPPTAYVTAATSFTSATNISVNISFTEPCSGGGGFRCPSVNDCNLLVYGAGQVEPNTVNVIQENLKFSLIVSLSSSPQYGRVILVMDKNFCTDSAGNKFMRTENSTFFVHFDRRMVFGNLRTCIPEKLLQLNSETRTVLATNEYKNLKVYLHFTKPVLNSSAEILNSLNTSQGSLLPITINSRGNRRFDFQVEDISSRDIVTVSLDSKLVISRQGTPVSSVAPVTFLYDSQRPVVRLSTASHMRTRKNNIAILIKFMKPVIGFNSSHITISGGRLQSFHEVSRSIYAVDIQADDDIVSVSVPENITADVSGNKNLPSNTIQVRHYTVPEISSVLSIFATAAFVVTSLAAGLVTISTAALQSVGMFSTPSSSLTSDPARNLFRIACHIQVYALSRWLAVTLPVEYYEFARGLQWSIPYFNLPWETGHVHPFMTGSITTNPYPYSSKIHDSGIYKSWLPEEEYYLDMDVSIYGIPLTAMEYESVFENRNLTPEAPYILDPHSSNGWRDFHRSMFWLAVITGSLILLHASLVLILKFRKKNSERPKNYGALVVPRFEIFLIILAVPCVCAASAALIRGGSSSGIIVGILLLGLVSFILLALLLFVSIGITFGKLVQYKEVLEEGQQFHWYQEIVRVTLGPGKKGQWAWKNLPRSVYLTMFGPLFEDLRGPPKYMLSQITHGNLPKLGDRIIASDDETEDAEAPFIQKVFGILRIYYTWLDFGRRVCLGIVAGAYSENRSSRTSIIILLSMTFFQLFFMVLKKPFIKKSVQLVEIVSVSCEVGIFSTCLVLVEKEFSANDETKIGILMLSFFFIAFMAQMIDEWFALYSQTKQLDTADYDSFFLGLKTASNGFLIFFIPPWLIRNLDSKFPQNNHGDGNIGDFGEGNKSLGGINSGSKASEVPTDPSSSHTKRGSSVFWSGKRSGSSSMTSSSDSKSKPGGLHKDLDAIFASK